jgi:hypothetical protein
MTVITRLATGFGVALLAIALLPIPVVVAKGLMIAALAPPGAVGVSESLETNCTSRSAFQIGTVVSVIIMAIILYGWRPWAM